VHIQSRADSDNVNGMMAMVMIVMMIVLVMVNIVPEALNQVLDSVRQHSCKTFQQLIDFHRPNLSQGKLNSSRCLHLSAAALKHCAVMQSSSRL
jgi:hypothetical protein